MIGVVLVDDHAVVREGYRALLSRQHDIDVVAEYGDADAAWRGMARTAPDIVIMDLNMPGASAIDVLARLHRQHACLRSLVFTMYVNPTLARRAFAAGARGFVTKSSAPDVLLAAVRRIAAGGRFVSTDIADSLALCELSGQSPACERLTERELEILRLMLAGRSARDIAATLHLSLKTVRNNHYALKRKLGVDSDLELARYCAELGLTP